MQIYLIECKQLDMHFIVIVFNKNKKKFIYYRVLCKHKSLTWMFAKNI